jgi:integrase
VIEQRGLPIDDDTYLTTLVRGTLDGAPWLGRITYEQAPVLARLLSTACYVLIAYLTGQRPAETSNLERGCIEHDEKTGLLLLRGRHWKGVRTPTGATNPKARSAPTPG